MTTKREAVDDAITCIKGIHELGKMPEQDRVRVMSLMQQTDPEGFEALGDVMGMLKTVVTSHLAKQRGLKVIKGGK